MASFLQSGQVRLVSNVMDSWRSGSIHSEVPVNPKCPNERLEKYFPDWDGDDGVSQPRAQDVPGGEDSRRVNSAKVSGRRMGYPPASMVWAKMARSPALANRLACGATPPITLAFSSCTSP